jgi:hypothetical protein
LCCHRVERSFNHFPRSLVHRSASRQKVATSSCTMSGGPQEIDWDR